MGMASAAFRWTADLVRTMPEDGNSYEVIHGRLFVNPPPSWTHQQAIARLFLLIAPYLESNKAGHVVFAPAAVEFDPETMVEPDLFVVPLAEGKLPKRWEDVRQLLLAVEVLSPSSRRLDRIYKRDLYIEHDAPEYWIVDVNSRVVERWRGSANQPQHLSERIIWQPAPGVQPLEIDLVRYFADVLGEVE